MRKFSLDDGDIIWETDITASSSRCVLARPVIVGDVVLAGTNDGQLVSLAASDGSVLWRQNFDNWLQLPPAAGQELVYISCDDQRLHIVDLATGAKVDSLEMEGYSGTAPVLCDGILYFGNTSGDFVALKGTLPEDEPEIPEDTPEELSGGVIEDSASDPGGMIQPLPSDSENESDSGTNSTETE